MIHIDSTSTVVVSGSDDVKTNDANALDTARIVDV